MSKGGFACLPRAVGSGLRIVTRFLVHLDDGHEAACDRDSVPRRLTQYGGSTRYSVKSGTNYGIPLMLLLLVVGRGEARCFEPLSLDS